MSVFTYKEKLDCAKRELEKRKTVYARWVADKRMSQKFADEQIGLMQSIVDDYAKAAKGEDLFGNAA